MNNDRKVQEWTTIIDFYNELIDKYKWPQKPMLEFIIELEKIGFYNKYWPSTSHEALGLNLEKEYEKRLESRMVYIVYKSDSNKFQISFQAGQGNEIRKKVCGKNLTKSDLKEIENWLTEK